MYIKNRVVKVLKIKNVIFTIAGIFNLIMSISVMASLISYYRDQLETVLYAKATPDTILWFIIAVILLFFAGISRRWIGDANFYSSYFEGNLDGYIQYSELALVTGKSEIATKMQLNLFRIIYMKGFELLVVNNEEQVVLNSKICTCQCKNCGALMEKRMYFTGVCAYCGSSDLFARVVADNRFYSISNNMSYGFNRPGFYTTKGIHFKKLGFAILLGLGLTVVVVGMIACMDSISNYNNEEYLRKVLLSGKGGSSFALIKADIMDSIILWAVIVLAFIPVVYQRYTKTKYIYAAYNCSHSFSLCSTPFVNVENLIMIKNSINKKRKMKSIRGALRRRYLINCTLEKHEGVLKVALAKQIVKDTCPFCAGAITGAVDENYRCRYCGNIIMGVICKK